MLGISRIGEKVNAIMEMSWMLKVSQQNLYDGKEFDDHHSTASGDRD